nr:hypothetical protein CFP56_54940 [Quercus suber]
MSGCPPLVVPRASAWWWCIPTRSSSGASSFGEKLSRLRHYQSPGQSVVGPVRFSAVETYGGLSSPYNRSASSLPQTPIPVGNDGMSTPCPTIGCVISRPTMRPTIVLQVICGPLREASICYRTPYGADKSRTQADPVDLYVGQVTFHVTPNTWVARPPCAVHYYVAREGGYKACLPPRVVSSGWSHDVYVVTSAPPDKPWRPDLQGQSSKIPSEITWLMSPQVDPEEQHYTFATMHHVEPEVLSRVQGYRYLGSFKFSEIDWDDAIERSWLILSYVSSRVSYSLRRSDVRETVWEDLSDRAEIAIASDEAMLERHVYKVNVFSNSRRALSAHHAEDCTYVFKWADPQDAWDDLMASWERSMATAILDAQRSSGVKILIHGASKFEMECLRAVWKEGDVVQDVSRLSLMEGVRLYLRLNKLVR